MSNVRRNLAVQLIAGGPNPLKLRLNGVLPYRKGTAVNASLIGQGGLLPYAFSIIVGSLPAGLSLNSSTGAITGTPTTVAAATFTAQVQDGSATVYSAQFTMNVLTPLVGIATQPPNFESFPTLFTTPYSYQFSVIGNTGAVTWSLVSGSLPSALSLGANGVISGNIGIGVTGVFTFTVRATDAAGSTLDIATGFSVFSHVSGNSLTLTPPAYLNTLYTADISATAASAGVAPFKFGKAASFSQYATISQSGVYTLNVPDSQSPGQYTSQVTITDALGFTTAGTVTVNVIVPNAVVQPQQNGVNQGTAGPATFNFAGTATVTNVAGVVTVTIGGSLIKRTVLTTGTSFTTQPTTNQIIVKALGAGGGGGGTTSVAASAACPGGGASGAWCEGILAVTPNTAYAYAIGQGGAGGAATGANGTNGGDSTFTVGATVLTGKGGSGGNGQAAVAVISFTLGGGSGSSTNGDVNGVASRGGAGMTLSGTQGISGFGANSSLGLGGQPKFTQGNGGAGGGFGAGGGGGCTLNGGAAVAGGAGTNGIIIVEEYT